jgi:hypothetical protein
MPVPSVRAISSGTSAGGSFSVGKPAGTQDGDLLVACQMTWLNAGSAPAAPTGAWTALDNQSWDGGAGDYHAYYRVAAGEPASWTFHCGSGQNSVAVVYAIQNADVAPEGHNFATASGTSSIATGSLTTLLGNEVLLAFFGEITVSAGGTISSTTAGATDDGFNASGTNLGMDTAHKSQALAGLTGAYTATCNGGTPAGVVGLLVSVPPPAAAGTGAPKIIAFVPRLHPSYLE